MNGIWEVIKIARKTIARIQFLTYQWSNVFHMKTIIPTQELKRTTLHCCVWEDRSRSPIGLNRFAFQFHQMLPAKTMTVNHSWWLAGVKLRLAFQLFFICVINHFFHIFDFNFIFFLFQFQNGKVSKESHFSVIELSISKMFFFYSALNNFGVIKTCFLFRFQ